jgi:type VI protein secretion system component Hcp
MSDTMSIHEDEIAAVAAKLDAGETLDEYDRVILRAVFLLAGKTVADLDDDMAEVAGFSQQPTDAFSLNFAKSLCDGSVRDAFQAGKGRANPTPFTFTHVYDKSSPIL